ncbi:LOW QUALITY PROTEIN: tubulin epsilon and delta complex protein 2 [Ochotona princeps]|uniref:LOW QUALITY PROTEIN: tubulin epsilon and delta complex protein 2 n=1 Tax=Ochotona princeps TaxID=9978 RepID=UPI00271526CB|nr:LOW QUALITY PROTEIN: tubulin epsilon and delta complex protein 2 [Ochotona princeps]
MLPAECSRRLLAELQGALDACAERQQQLERNLGVCRRLLRAWEPAKTLAPEPTPGSETKEDDPTLVCTPIPQDLQELELLTQALEKAVRVRESVSRAAARDKKAASWQPGSSAAASLRTTASASSQGGLHPSGPGPTKGIRQAAAPAKDRPELRPLPGGRDRVLPAKPGHSLEDQQAAPFSAPQALAAFTLEEHGRLLRLPVALRKAISQNFRLWAQLSSVQTSDSSDGAAVAAKAHFLQKLQVAISLQAHGSHGRLLALNLTGLKGHSPALGMVGAEPGHRGFLDLCPIWLAQPGAQWCRGAAADALLRKACSLMRLHMREALATAPTDWIQEYHCLLTLEGLQAMVGQCLRRLQELRAAVLEQPPGPHPARWHHQSSVPHEDRAGPAGRPQLLLYSGTQELQTLAACNLRVAMLDQQIHLQKVLMAELLPLVGSQEPPRPPSLALCRALHSLLCESGAHFLTVLRDDPVDAPAD